MTVVTASNLTPRWPQIAPKNIYNFKFFWGENTPRPPSTWSAFGALGPLKLLKYEYTLTYGWLRHCPREICYSSQDLWYTQSQTGRPTYDVVWGSQQSRPVTATGMSAAAAWHPEGDEYSRSQRQLVPLDAPDVALRGQRLMAYKERLRQEEGRASQETGWARPSNR